MKKDRDPKVVRLQRPQNDPLRTEFDLGLEPDPNSHGWRVQKYPREIADRHTADILVFPDPDWSDE